MRKFNEREEERIIKFRQWRRLTQLLPLVYRITLNRPDTPYYPQLEELKDGRWTGVDWLPVSDIPSITSAYIAQPQQPKRAKKKLVPRKPSKKK